MLYARSLNQLVGPQEHCRSDPEAARWIGTAAIFRQA